MYLCTLFISDQDALLEEIRWEPPTLQNRIFHPVDENIDWQKNFVVFSQKWGHIREQRCVGKYSRWC